LSLEAFSVELWLERAAAAWPEHAVSVAGSTLATL
jgi:hypothetical protein